jgi:hypothetical protein
MEALMATGTKHTAGEEHRSMSAQQPPFGHSPSSWPMQAVPGGARASTWLEIIKAAPALLLTLLALIAAYEIGPELWKLFKSGAVTKIGIGAVNLELAQRRLTEVKGLDASGVPKAEQDKLKRRFLNVADYANEARILWVDDQHPQQNVRERRVLSALSIPIDLATSTDAALGWLRRADYDILITDLTREKDQSSPCYDGPEAPARAGCDLIKKIGLLGNVKAPAIIVYASQIDGIVRPSAQLHATNNPTKFFHAIIDAIERMDRQQ